MSAKRAHRQPLYSIEEKRRRDATPWTLVQGILAPLQFLAFLVSLALVLRYLATGEGLWIATCSIVIKTLLLYAIMTTGSIWERVVFGRYLFAPAFFWEDVFSILVLALHTGTTQLAHGAAAVRLTPGSPFDALALSAPRVLHVDANVSLSGPISGGNAITTTVRVFLNPAGGVVSAPAGAVGNQMAEQIVGVTYSGSNTWSRVAGLGSARSRANSTTCRAESLQRAHTVLWQAVLPCGNTLAACAHSLT